MRIALCDDDPAMCALLSERIQAYCGEARLALQLDRFPCAEALLASAQSYEIIFLDIYMAGMTGMEAAHALAPRKECQIVFITTSREHALEAFSVNAAHYLVKPLAEGDVEEAMERCLANLGKRPVQIITLKNSLGTVPVPLPSIVYMEVCDKVLSVYTEHGAIRVYTPLDAICEQLDDTFLRVQRSFVVNMRCIESFLPDRVVLRSGVVITLSRVNRTELKNKYQQFLFRLAREG